MSFQESIAKCMANYATFEGRASRSEFWWFYLFCILIQWFAQVVFTVTSGPEIGAAFSMIVSLALVTPIWLYQPEDSMIQTKVAGDIFGA